MLEDLYQTHRPVALQKGLEFTLHYNGELPAQIRGDALRLGQILNNIVSNALKFTDHGQVTLTAESLPGHCIRFTVEDTGVGIPEAEQNDIFAPFSQVRRTDGRKFDGSGLGLSIARALVEMQGGTLELRSAQGKGSTFTVTLPFAESSAAAVSDELPASAEPPDFKGKRILYVEDVASNQEVMAALLEETGADLRWVETGSDALNTLQKEAFDIALLDLQLPDMSGLELAEKIRNQWPQLPMVAVTAQAGASVNERCLAAGMLGVVLKPIDPARLFAWISQASPEANHSANPTAAESPSQASPGNFRTVLEQLFGKQPERIERMLATLATEFDQHHRVLTDVLETDNIAEIRSLRHKMHSALTQFGMESLRHDLDLLVDAQANLKKDAELQHRCLAALKSAAEQFRRA
jgi:CheY-like chemotaxis protein/anti-sigma regulatory factor (Ser/Thr protein kinase)